MVTLHSYYCKYSQITVKLQSNYTAKNVLLRYRISESLLIIRFVTTISGNHVITQFTESIK